MIYVWMIAAFVVSLAGLGVFLWWVRTSRAQLLTGGPWGYLEGDRVTDADLQWVREHDKCPVCRQGDMLAGPRGGLAQNFRCSSCETVMNATPFGIDILRLGPALSAAHREVEALETRQGETT